MQDKSKFVCFHLIKTQFVFLFVNNLYRTFSIYAGEHAVEHVMHKIFDDTRTLNPQTTVSHTFPTMRSNVTLAIWISALKQEENAMTRPRAEMIWKPVSNQVSE